MPFKSAQSRPFTKQGVEMFSTNEDGVYGLFVGSGPWVFVGKGNIRVRLLAHINGDNASITSAKPTHWRAEVTASMDKRESELILELNPKCNQHAV